MSNERLHFAPALSGLGALGLSEPAALFEGPLGPRAELVESVAGRARLRFPLPGTPGADGRLRGAPAGSGTGWVSLRRWSRASWGELLRARFTAPRSASLAEREWNLLCHLRAHGVGTPEPLAVGARGEGLIARRSFLVTRDLEGHLGLGDWLATAGGDPRRRGLAALAVLLANLLRSGVLMAPSMAAIALRPEGVACGAEAPGGGAGGPRLNRWPSVVLAELGGARLAPHQSLARRALDLRPLARELAPRLSVREGARLFLVVARSLDRDREHDEVGHGSGPPRVERRAIWRALVR